MEQLKITVGVDQELMIDNLLMIDMKSNVISLEKTYEWKNKGTTNERIDGVNYKIDFKDNYSIYLFGHKQASLMYNHFV